MASILSLDHEAAFDYFMESEHYNNFELPEYYCFDNILKYIREQIGRTPYLDCLSEVCPEDLPNVNMDLLLNKDGRYAVRPLTLANPYLYYFLVRELCSEDGWKLTKDCFKKYKVSHISSCALPQFKEPDKKEAFHNSNTILNWWNTVEQRSLELSLEYRYMFVTDITNCYGSINPQSIDWALTFKGTKYENEDYLPVAKNIRMYLGALQNGRNIGIPQGSYIFDFVAEIILGYADLLLSEALEKEGITDGYEIIRYRDDYRVFCNDNDRLERISYTLQHVLEKLNLRLNSSKTHISNSIITDSIKSDKLYYIENTPIFNKKGCDFDGLQKHLLYILLFGRKFPNGGQLRTMLSDIDKRIERLLRPKNKENTSKETKETKVCFGLTDANSKNEKGSIKKELTDSDIEAMDDLFNDSDWEDVDIETEAVDSSFESEGLTNVDFDKVEALIPKNETEDFGLSDSDFEAIEATINSETKDLELSDTDLEGVEGTIKKGTIKRRVLGESLLRKHNRKIVENITAMSAICVQIAIENVSCVHYALRVMSRMVNSIEDSEEKWSIFDKACAKLVSRPNSDYDKIWLQNITYQRDKADGKCPYDVRLCQLASGSDVKLWDNSWLKPLYTEKLPMKSICDKDLLVKITPVITFRETRAYYNM
ncbi:RNA-directed DNA polymerase [Lepagella muris]|jgi:hypothetical protein|uniref:RNA-directed DNA polymerase n=1 Tax=Lepagella muris TaxID=3032870 RepID=UPI0023B8118C|nr:RNA-directed DNA polymerase [Lepagella muris]